MPLFGVFFFVFTIFNAAVPLSANWIGETLCLIGTFQRNPIAGVLGATGIVLSAAYSIWLYNRLTFGTWSPYLNYSGTKMSIDITRREYILLLPLLFLSILFGIYPNVVLNDIHNSVSSLIYIN
jgi:NADH-ubiquinone oxidoreductase chain 4